MIKIDIDIPKDMGRTGLAYRELLYVQRHGRGRDMLAIYRRAYARRWGREASAAEVRLAMQSRVISNSSREDCRAKDPAQCPYHGTPEHADEQGSSSSHRLSSPDSPADTAPPKDDATPAERAAAVEDIRSLLSGQRQVHFDDSVPTSMIREITNSLASLKEKYPVDNLQSIGSYKDDNDSVYAEADRIGIRINHDAGTAGIFNTPKKLDPQKNGGFSRSVVAASYKRPLDGIIAHEYAHLIAFHCENDARTSIYSGKKKATLWNSWEKVFYNNRRNNINLFKDISRRSIESPAEFFAECFAMHVNGAKIPKFAKKNFTDILNKGILRS